MCHQIEGLGSLMQILDQIEANTTYRPLKLFLKYQIFCNILISLPNQPPDQINVALLRKGGYLGGDLGAKTFGVGGCLGGDLGGKMNC